jgi:hypothetical protein
MMANTGLQPATELLTRIKVSKTILERHLNMGTYNICPGGVAPRVGQAECHKNKGVGFAHRPLRPTQSCGDRLDFTHFLGAAV